MGKSLKVVFPEKCIGCELCIFEMQKQLNKVGLEGSLIRISKKPTESGGLEFSIILDSQIDNMDVQKIKDICPVFVFDVIESND